MASNGVRRKIDDLGRVVIPASIRRALAIREGDAVEVTVEGERVVIARPQDTCVFCGRDDASLQPFRGRLVCGTCVAMISEVAGRAPHDEPATPAASPPAGPKAAAATAPVRDAHSAPAGLPEGPIDGDAMAREAARQAAARRQATREGTPARTPARHEQDQVSRRPRPPYDPASTTSW